MYEGSDYKYHAYPLSNRVTLTSDLVDQKHTHFRMPQSLSEPYVSFNPFLTHRAKHTHTNIHLFEGYIYTGECYTVSAWIKRQCL